MANRPILVRALRHYFHQASVAQMVDWHVGTFGRNKVGTFDWKNRNFTSYWTFDRNFCLSFWTFDWNFSIFQIKVSIYWASLKSLIKLKSTSELSTRATVRVVAGNCCIVPVIMLINCKVATRILVILGIKYSPARLLCSIFLVLRCSRCRRWL